MIWIKSRNYTNNHFLIDSIRGKDGGTTYENVYPNLNSAQANDSGITAIGSTSFTTGNARFASNDWVAWAWKAGGAAATNTDGTISTQVSANTTSGFSISKYTGNGVSGATFAHGLGGQVNMSMVKRTDSPAYWYVYSSLLPANNNLYLNTIDPKQVDNVMLGGNTETVSISSSASVNANGGQYVAYNFTSKPGFSKVGTYTGNGTSQNISTGFKVSFVIIKSATSSQSWMMYDSTRGGNKYLEANSAGAEGSSGSNLVNFYTNGFGVSSSNSENQSGQTFIYLAFAADPSTTTPSLANSFATELYTGNGGTKTVTTGFKTDLVWLKSESASYPPYMADSVRGTLKVLRSSGQDAQSTGSGVSSFGSTSFDVTGGGENQSGGSYVSWNWKAGGTPSINTDGTLTGVVSANQAAGFSIVQWNGNGTVGATVGHGLNAVPELFITKNITATNLNWATYNVTTGNSARLTLNESAAASTGRIEWDSTTPTSSVITFSDHPCVNSSNVSYIGYAFTSISNYSKVGNFSGSGSSGNFQNIGFTPTWIMIKAYQGGGSDWYILDNKRPGGNTTREFLGANLVGGTYNASETNAMQFVTNGFQFGGSSFNTSGYDYIYLAIKEN